MRLQTFRTSLVLSLAACGVLGAASVNDVPMGWASQNGGTTGGKGGTEVTVTTMADLQKYAKMSGKYIIWVKGTMGSYGTRGNGNGDRVVLSSDKSILGLPGAHIKGGLDLNNVKNVIIRNVTVEGPGAVDNNGGTAGEGRQDAISIVNEAKNIWLDHIHVLDGEDGNADVTKASDFVTISWSRFTYTDKSYVSGVTDWSHRFCNLLGGSDTEKASSGATSVDKLNVTFYKTHWGQGVAERMPRVRFGKVHVANCLFNSTDKGQGHNIRAAYKANILVEGSVFNKQKKPIDLFDGDFTAITVKNTNVFNSCTGNMAGSGTAFTPPYTLPLSAAAGLEAELTNATSGAGPTLTWGTTSVEKKAPTFAYLHTEIQGGRQFVVNSEAQDVTVTVSDLAGRQEISGLALRAGERAELPASSGVRILSIQSGSLRESRMISASR
jgi:pectate lyase